MRVLLVGDTHGNTPWLERTVIPTALANDAALIIQVGDFGWWPDRDSGRRFIAAARSSPVPILFLDGNHEHHPSLACAMRDARTDDIVPMGGSLGYLPRGTVLDLDGVRALACGGAHSIDRQLRRAGVGWFDEEHVSTEDVERCAAAGTVDVLLCHDAPAGWAIPDMQEDHRLPARWRAELPDCHAHRDVLATVMAACRPRVVVHGHYHQAYELGVAMAWGEVSVLGLSEDGTSGALAILHCRDGAVEVCPAPGSTQAPQ